MQSIDCNSEGVHSLLTNALPSSASAIMTEAMSMDKEVPKKEHVDTHTTHSSDDDDQLGHSSATAQQSKDQLVEVLAFVSDHNLVRATVLVPSYVPSEADEKIIVELPSLIQPLKVARGTFGVSTIQLLSSTCDLTKSWKCAIQFLV